MGFLVIQEILRIMMGASEELAIDLKQSIIMIVIVGIIAVIQQIIIEIHNKNKEK